MGTDKIDTGDLTQLLRDYAQGNQAAFGSLIERVYEELRSIASGHLRAESRNPLMSPTALVHEAYLRLVNPEAQTEWVNRRHFFAAATETMRRILVDQARQRMALKRGGHAITHPLDDFEIPAEVSDEELIDIDAALEEFARTHPDKCELVKLRFFTGLTEVETAEILGISRATASRNWTYAKAWLFDWIKTHA